MKSSLARCGASSNLTWVLSVTSTDTAQTAQNQYASATRAGNIDALLSLGAPGAVVWHNHDAREISWEQAAKTIGWMHRTMPDVSWEDAAIWWIPDGFIWQVVLTASVPNGPIAAHLCMIVRVSPEGLINRIEEYMDPAAFSPLTS
jgi:hypothetical protein